MQHHLVSTPSPAAKDSKRFTPLCVIIMIREMPSFPSVLTAMPFDFYLFCDVITATVVNHHYFNTSYSRKCRGKNMPGLFYRRLYPFSLGSTWVGSVLAFNLFLPALFLSQYSTAIVAGFAFS